MPPVCIYGCLQIAYSDFKALNSLPSSSAADFVVSTTNKELLFNPDCYVGIILDYIYQIVGIPKEERDNVDILDKKMNFMNIFLYSPNSEGIELFNHKMKYYLAHRKGEFLKNLWQISILSYFQAPGRLLLFLEDLIQPLLAAGSDEYQEFFNILKRRSKKRSSLSATSKDSKRSSSVNKTSLSVLQQFSGAVLTKRSLK